MLISFITPTYNHEKYIEKNILSVLDQTHPDIEHIIVDDGSTDKTGEIARRYSDKYSSIKYFFQENKGVNRLAETYNFAVSQSKGDIIAILEGDDWALPDRALTHVDVFKDQNVIVSWGVTERWKDSLFLGYSPTNYRDFNSISSKEFIVMMLQQCYIPANTAAIRRTALDQIGGFQSGEYYVDYPTWLALIPLGKFQFSPVVLSVWGVHSDSYSTIFGPTARPDLDAVKAFNKYPEELKKLTSEQEIFRAWKKICMKSKIMSLINRVMGKTHRIKPIWTANSMFLYHVGSTYAIPTSLGVCITPYCNIKCKYCMREQFTPQGKPMSLETLKFVLSKMPYVGDICIMGLCEPYLNPELPSMLKWLKSNGYRIALTTNGTIPIKDIEALTNVDDMVFSIDTNDPETFTYLRGGAQLHKVMENFNNVISFKRAHGLGKLDNPPIHINSVITQQNIDQMPGLFKMLEPYADDITYIMVDPVSRPDYQTFEKPLALTGDEYSHKIDNIRQIARKSHLSILGFDYMLTPSHRWDKCALSWYEMFIQPNGDAYFCYDYRRVLGNVFTEDPLKVWNSECARNFRKELLSPDPPIDQCKSCNFARHGWQPSGEYLSNQGKIKCDVNDIEK
jgi:radical SAM protein with 4Fe4S-binding SPASM domain